MSILAIILGCALVLSFIVNIALAHALNIAVNERNTYSTPVKPIEWDCEDGIWKEV